MKFINHIVRLIIVVFFAVGMVALMKAVSSTIIIAVLAAMLAGCIFDEIKREFGKKVDTNEKG